MIWRVCVLLTCVLLPVTALAQQKPDPKIETKTAKPIHTAAATAVPAPQPEAPHASTALIASVSFADVGFAAGLRFSNLGGRREVFVPLPPGANLAANELVLTLDDISAHEAKRSLEILVNDRTATSVALDGKSNGRVVRVPLGRAQGREGFLKLTFVYSGAATQDRCIDVRSIGDSLTVRPESAIEIEIGSPALDVATTAALMPRDVAVVLSSQRLSNADLAAALTVGRTLIASGRRVHFHHGFETLPELTKRDDARRWTRGLVLIGSASEVASYIEIPGARVAGPAPALGTLSAVKAQGLPALLVSDDGAVRAARLFGSSQLAAARGVSAASVGDGAAQKLTATRVTFDQLGLVPPVAEVFGRADIIFVVPTKALPAATRPSRLALDLMVAPDGAGEKAVVSVFVNERLLGSTVAAIGEPTHLDLPLPDGLVGTDLNVRAMVQRRSAQGDCRFEPQGYPAQIIGSSAIVVVDAGAHPHDFADLTAWWSGGVEVWMPSPASQRPAGTLGLVADALAALSPESAPVTVKFLNNGEAPAPIAPFIAVSAQPPVGASPRVRFDQGRVVVADRAGKTLLDVGGFTQGSVAQIVSSGPNPGLWLKPLASNGTLPAPDDVRLDRGDVAFVDPSGIALAMSTERDTLLRVSYPDQVSWFTIAERFNPWIIGTFWLLISIAFLFGLQRMRRLRSTISKS